MLIAQITDLHLDAHKGTRCKNTHQLRRVVEDIKRMSRQPDILLITGDLVEQGELSSYKSVKTELSNFNIPIYFTLGNHDDREAFAGCFPESQFNDGFLQYSIEGESLRIIVIDSSEPGRHGGAFCERRADWLRNELAKAPEKPTLIAMHHPPTDIGIPWMTTRDEAPWAQRFKTIVSAYDNIVHIMCGHIHRPIFKRFAGTTLSIASAIAPEVKLDLSDIDLHTPDGRVLLEDTNPGYALHHWDSEALTTHNIIVGGRPLIYYDQAHAHIVRETLAQA